jgi:hypothetical protein
VANNGGDVLARGARKANFPAAGGNVSQEKWNAIWADEDEIAVQEETKKKKSKE